VPSNDGPDGDESLDSRSDSHLILPDDLRSELKQPFGPIETDAETLLESVSGPLVAVGDVVTYHLLEAGRPPDVAIVDERTERETVDESIRQTVADEPQFEVTNPPATIAEPAVRAFCEALAADGPTTILVDGEEDLLALPAIVAAPTGATVVYGQPGEGMVCVTVTDEISSEVRRLLEGFEGDDEWLWPCLEASDE